MFSFSSSNKKNGASNAASNVTATIKSFKKQGLMKKGQEMCSYALQEIPSEDRTTIFNLVNAVPGIIDYLKAEASAMISKYDLSKVEDVTKMLKKVTEMVKKSGHQIKSIVRIFEKKHVDKIDKVIKAATAYLKCLISHIPVEYKAMLVASMELVMAMVHVIAKEPKLIEFSSYAISSVKHSSKDLVKGIKVKNTNANAKTKKNNAKKNA